MRDATPLLSLDLLERVHTYDGIARELGVDRDTARRAVCDAIEAVVAERKPAPPESIRAQIVDYLLGEQTLPQRMRTRELLDRSRLGRAWAIEARLSLGQVMEAPMPLIPDPDSDTDVPAALHRALALGDPAAPTAAAPPGPDRPSPHRPAPHRPAPHRPAAPGRRVRGSRPEAPPRLALAGARVGRRGVVRSRRVYLIRRLTAIAGLATLLAAAIVIPVIASGPSTRAQSGRAAGRQATLQRLALAPTSAQPRATGLAAIVRQRGGLLLLLQGRHMVPNRHDYYAVWLYNTEADAELLGLVTPPVGSSRTFFSGVTLPEDAVRFHRLVVTSETSATPARPGPRILSSPLSVQ